MKQNKINIIKVANSSNGIGRAFDLVMDNISNSVFWLSGGSTPKSLYEQLTKEISFKPKGVALVDERYGQPDHKDSNELMIRNTGLINALEKNNIQFHSILSDFEIQNSDLPTPKDVATRYNKVANELIKNNTKHILVLGLGPDGHTAGIFPDLYTSHPELENSHPEFISGSSNKALKQAQGDNIFITSYHTKSNQFHDRITLTPYALETLAIKDTLMIVLAFGRDKKEAIQKMLHHDPASPEPPAAIYHHLTPLGCKVYLITDQIK